MKFEVRICWEAEQGRVKVKVGLWRGEGWWQNEMKINALD